MLIYFSYPYIKGTNKEMVRTHCRGAISAGDIPVSAHLLYRKFKDEEKEKGMRRNLMLLGRCDEMWVFGRPDPAVKAEIEYAKEKNIPIRFMDRSEEC